jgi:hypothetical protein
VLAEVLPRLRLAPDTAIVLQHANNPYGFAWHRRVNESNVDVNRNFLQRFDPALCDEDYERLNAELNPPDLDPANEAARWARIDSFTAEHGPRRFQQAAFAGQYRYPKGLQFGGAPVVALGQLRVDLVDSLGRRVHEILHQGPQGEDSFFDALELSAEALGHRVTPQNERSPIVVLRSYHGRSALGPCEEMVRTWLRRALDHDHSTVSHPMALQKAPIFEPNSCACGFARKALINNQYLVAA